MYSGSVSGSHGLHSLLLRGGRGTRHEEDARRTRRVDNGSYPEFSPGRAPGASLLVRTECRAMSDGGVAWMGRQQADRCHRHRWMHARPDGQGPGHAGRRQVPGLPSRQDSLHTHSPRSTSLKSPTAGLATRLYAVAFAPALICARRSNINLAGLSASRDVGTCVEHVQDRYCRIQPSRPPQTRLI